MKLPNKVITYKESTISKFPSVLSCLKEQDMSPALLYKKVKSKVEDIGEYIDILDCLSRFSILLPFFCFCNRKRGHLP